MCPANGGVGGLRMAQGQKRAQIIGASPSLLNQSRKLSRFERESAFVAFVIREADDTNVGWQILSLDYVGVKKRDE